MFRNIQLNKNTLKNKQMTTSNFTTSIVVDQTPKEVFDDINNPQGWW